MLHLPQSERILPYGRETANVLCRWVAAEEFPLAQRLCQYLATLMRKNYCVGISAPQVGVFSQVAVVERQDGSLLELINPNIARMYGKELMGFEACMSLPPSGNGCWVPRMETVDIDYFSPQNPRSLQRITLKGFDAVVAQHEIDHLTGTFFLERVSAKERTRVLENFQPRKDAQHGHAKITSRSQPSYCR